MVAYQNLVPYSAWNLGDHNKLVEAPHNLVPVGHHNQVSVDHHNLAPCVPRQKWLVGATVEGLLEAPLEAPCMDPQSQTQVACGGRLVVGAHMNVPEMVLQDQGATAVPA